MKGGNQKLVEELQEKVFRLFSYRFDEHQYMVEEHWTSHADAVENNEVFTDDCDGYACTMAELLLRNGVPASDIKLIYCITETGEAHLVCGVDSLDDTYIAENRFRRVYPWQSKPGYQWKYMMTLDDKGVWKKIT